MKKTISIILCFFVLFSFSSCSKQETIPPNISATLENIPKFTGEPYVIINNNQPEFTEEDITKKSFEKYSELDNLNRCGVAFACIGQDIMPTEERGEIGMIKPSGWHTVKYDEVDGKYLYNRCHLIGFQLSGENANKNNLVTGTRFMNIEGMLPFENQIADYVKETDNHVMYRVTPIFRGNELLCYGVQMEGYSVEDNGEGICFNVFAYNAQPGIEIDYLTGKSKLISARENSNEYGETTLPQASIAESQEKYTLNVNSKKIHLSTCYQAKRIQKENAKEHIGDITEYLNIGYSKCQVCLKED